MVNKPRLGLPKNWAGAVSLMPRRAGLATPAVGYNGKQVRPRVRPSATTSATAASTP